MQILLDDIVQVELDGDPLNPRGFVRDTVGLQRSMRQEGQLSPIEVYPLAGKYGITKGHRRVVAARALGWNAIEAVIIPPPESDDAVFSRMLSDFVREDLTPSQWGYSLKRLLEFGRALPAAAALCGLEVDKAELYLSLLDQPEALVKRLDRGELSLTAYKAIRDKPTAVKQDVAKMERPTVVRVRAHVAKEEGRESAALFDLPDDALIQEINALKARVLAAWPTLTLADQVRIQYAISGFGQVVLGGHHE